MTSIVNLGSRIGGGGIIKAMVPNTNDKFSHIRGKVIPARRPERIEIPQGIPQIGKSVARDGPIGNIVLYLCRTHVIDILGIINAPHRLHDADN